MPSYLYLVIGVFVIVPLLALWIWCIFDAFARPDLKLTAKVLWAVAVLIFPLAGGVAYLIFRARRKPSVYGTEYLEGTNYEPLRTSSSDAPDRTTW
jgi:hypothetical protein